MLAQLDLTPPTIKAWRRVLLRDPCAYCGEPSAEIDHITPSGSNDLNNLTGSCRLCNRRKRATTILAFISRQPIGPNPETTSTDRMTLRAEWRARNAT